MAVHNFVGDAFRGATWVALHNGGGVGWWAEPVLQELRLSAFAVYLLLVSPCRGEVINGGFGLLLDGSDEAARRASLMLNWDVSNGVRHADRDTGSEPASRPVWPVSRLSQVARRCWSGNSNAYETIQRTMEENRQLRVTMPFPVQDERVVERALQG